MSAPPSEMDVIVFVLIFLQTHVFLLNNMMMIHVIDLSEKMVFTFLDEFLSTKINDDPFLKKRMVP